MATVSIQSFPNIQEFLDGLKAKWTAENPSVTSWVAVPYDYLLKGFKFILSNVDEAIHLVEGMGQPGANKKALVIDLAGKLFDYIIQPAMPTWLKPFVPVMKNIVVNVVIPNLIDFIVSKYNSGSWSK